MTRFYHLKRVSYLNQSWPLAPSLLCMAAALCLAACGQDGPVQEPPVAPEVLETVVAKPGVSREQLARKIDALFTAEDMGETYGVVVMHRGSIVAERYGDDFNAETRFTGWSVSKTVTGVLTGMMVADGRLKMDRSPPIPHWQRSGDPRGDITLRQLLQMRSGLRHQERAEPVYTSDEVRMMFLDGRDHMAAWAEAQPLEHEPGRVFEYSTASAVILSDIAARLLAPDGTPQERQSAMERFLSARLAVPLGMTSLVAEYDAAGTMMGGSSIWANARDWARFGEFMRHGGSVSGAQIVPRSWIDFMHRESPRAPDYGAMLWLNRPSGTDREILFPGTGPDTIFGAVGHLGQFVLVSPDQYLTVVRFGHTLPEDQAALTNAMGDIVALYPQR